MANTLRVSLFEPPADYDVSRHKDRTTADCWHVFALPSLFPEIGSVPSALTQLGQSLTRSGHCGLGSCALAFNRIEFVGKRRSSCIQPSRISPEPMLRRCMWSRTPSSSLLGWPF